MKPLKQVRFDERFRLQGARALLRLVRNKDARRRDGITEVQVEGDTTPTFWIDWETEVVIAEQTPYEQVQNAL